MDKLVKRFIIDGDKVVPELDFFLEKAGWSFEKSAATKVSEFQIYVGTFKTSGSYKYNTYGFSMNEIEAEFDYANGDMLTLTLRDTSVNKKIEITDKGGIFTYARGQDTVGKHSEANYLTTREPIVNLMINGNEYRAGMGDTNTLIKEDIYKDLTGLDMSFLTEDDLEEDRESTNLWQSLMEQMEEGK